METALIWSRLRHRTSGLQKVGKAPQCIALPPHALWSATLQTGTRVTCERGLVWLTQSGDTNDYILRAGEYFMAQCSGQVVVQSFEDSRLRVE